MGILCSNKLNELIITELMSLTGETANKLHTWLSRSKPFPLSPKSRTAFSRKFSKYVDVKPEKTCDCELGSRPLYCRIRFRAIRIRTLYQPDKEKLDQGLILLIAYEACSSFFYYQLYKELDELFDDDEEHGLPIDQFSDFCLEAARRVGLPISRIILTNRFILNSDRALMSIDAIRENLKKKLDGHLNQRLIIEGELTNNFSENIYSIDMPTLSFQAKIKKFVNSHNEKFAIPKIKLGRSVFKSLMPKHTLFPCSPGRNFKKLLEIYCVKDAHPLADLQIKSSLKPLVYSNTSDTE
jgi:hypothetical protein